MKENMFILVECKSKCYKVSFKKLINQTLKGHSKAKMYIMNILYVIVTIK